MTQTITWETLMAALAGVVMIFGMWRQWATTINSINKDIQAYKLHVAETYATKEGVNKQYEAVSKSINDVGERMEKRLDGMNERLDRVIEAGNQKTALLAVAPK